jgi:ABC-type transport system involved in multi-copper enzyme maturation permease subunit
MRGIASVLVVIAAIAALLVLNVGVPVITNPSLGVLVLINGATFATVAVIIPAFLLSRFTREIVGRSVLIIFLFIATGAYFGFATLGREVVDTQSIWMLVELAQVIVFGALALLGLRGSPYWLAAGWALHPFWDFLLHYIGPGHPFTPWTYAIACISFDWLIAVYIVIAYGVLGVRRLGFREPVATT